jgi:hypothetical protein
VGSYCQLQPVSERHSKIAGHRGQVREVQHALTLPRRPAR